MNDCNNNTLKPYIADLHTHTVLSPCGDIYMSPQLIVKQAQKRGIDILGITDHNSTKHCRVISQLAAANGIFTLCGAEVTSKEEIHCLTFFENFEILDDFQQLLEKKITRIPFDTEDFGEQVLVNENEEIIEELDYLLISSLSLSIEQVAEEVYQRGGLFIPAHINRPYNSLFSQLGIIPDGLRFHALELAKKTKAEDIIKMYPALKNTSFIKSSDAHFPEQVGKHTSTFHLQNRSFQEIKMALNKEQGRHVTI